MISTDILLIALIAIIVLSTFIILKTGKLRSHPSEEIPEKIYSKILERQHIEADIQRRNFEESSAKILEETRRQYETQISRLEERLYLQAEDLRKASATQFEALSAAALERQSDRLAEDSRHELQTLLNPLRENLGEFRKAVNDSYMEENASREALNKQISSLIAANSQISIEARRLSEAMHGNSRLQGMWGEQVLESMCKMPDF